jgi:hypothetical protein
LGKVVGGYCGWQRTGESATNQILSGAFLRSEFALSSGHDWVNHEIEFLKGNFISCAVRPTDCDLVKVVCVYSPAWPVNKDRLVGIDVSRIKSSSTNPDVYGTDILWDTLTNAVGTDDRWIVGGDFNSSETFDREWQRRNKRRFGFQSSGNAEMLERMNHLGFTECLRKSKDDPIVPTFRHSRGSIHHQIDHLFVSNGLFSRLDKCTVAEQAVVFGGGLSDHLPIIADFSIEFTVPAEGGVSLLAT